MARYLHPNVLDNGPAYLRANCTRIVAVVAYAAGDSYTTVTGAGNVVASVDVSSADFSFTDGTSGARVLNNAATLTDASADAAGNPTHFVFLDVANSAVLRATEETSAGTISAGGNVTFPNLPLVSQQPVAA